MDVAHEQVRAWVESMDAQGYTSDEIRAQLALAGWTKEDIEGLLGEPVAPAPAVAPAVVEPPVVPAVSAAPLVPPPVGQAPVGQAPVIAPPVIAPPVETPPVETPPVAGHVRAPAVTPGVPAAQPNGMATAALILGIASVFFGPLLALVGLVLGIVGMKRGGAQRGQAVGGLTISAVVLAGWLLLGGIAFIGATYGTHSSSEDSSSSREIQEEQAAPESDEVKPGNLNEPLGKLEKEETVVGKKTAVAFRHEGGLDLAYTDRHTPGEEEGKLRKRD